MPFSVPAQFYSPKYSVKAPNTIKDFRSTIFWEPDLMTNANGKATLNFYSADKPGNYTLTIEGADMQGSIGRRYQKVAIR
jgi:hypothetical protein